MNDFKDERHEEEQQLRTQPHDHGPECSEPQDHIRSGPIPAIDWPAMKMEFAVAPQLILRS